MTLTTALLTALSGTAGALIGGMTESAGGDAWDTLTTKLARWRKLNERTDAAAFDQAVQEALRNFRRSHPHDPAAEHALALLTDESLEGQRFRQAALEELVFSAQPDIGRLTALYQHHMRFWVALRGQGPPPAWETLEAPLHDFLSTHLRQALQDQPHFRPLVLEQADLQALDAARITARATSAMAETLTNIETMMRDFLQERHAALVSTGPSALQAERVPSGVAYLVLPLLTALQTHDDQDEVVDVLDDLELEREHRKVVRRLLKEADLRAVIHSFDSAAPSAQACRALIEALSDAQTVQQAETITLSMTAHTMTNVSQTVVHHQYNYAASPDPQQARQRRALTDYLRSLHSTCAALQLAQLDEREAAAKKQMPLERVYIGLNTESRVKLTDAEIAQLRERDSSFAFRPREEHPTRPLTALEAVTAPHPARLMLLGAPGSGKTTFVNHLALCLVGTRFAPQDDAGEHADGWLTRLPAWVHGALLPLRIILRDLAAFAPLEQAAHGSVEVLLAFLTQMLGPHHDALDAIRTDLSNGAAILLFDGLDEVVGDAVLARVVEMMTDAANTYTHCPVLVTCRVLDYQANPRRHLPGFRVETLTALDDDQIQQFVVAWYAELHTSGRQMLGTAAGLQQAIAARSELRDLARQPLLLTMMAIVHAGKGELPHSRAMLYAECIDLLLRRWRKPADEPDILTRLNLPQFSPSDLLAAMARLGYTAHDQAERNPDADATRPADLDRAQVQYQLEQVFVPYTTSDERREHLVSVLLHAIAARNGLLLKRSGEQGHVYSFPHRSFQEFLAGYYISVQGEYDRLALERAAYIHWHEALRLMVSHQVLSQPPNRGQPMALARDLQERGALEQILAGEILAMVGAVAARTYRPDLAEKLWPRARAQLLALATEGQAPDTPHALRVRAGLALGQVCYGQVRDLAQGSGDTMWDDPRLLDLRTGNAPDEHYWCAVEAGDFWYGDDGEGKELQQVNLPDPFEIARYLVTNAEYARFIADDGYHPEKPWWTEQGRWYISPEGERRWEPDELKGKPITLPRLWHDSRFNNLAQPVVGVSWYEAAAYCRWLTAQGHTQGWLPQNAEIRLPTSLEWERAARHTDKRPYPWGSDEPTPEHANYQETGIGAPSPVGCFPRGGAVCGALDMAGNVLEWLATPYAQPQQVEPAEDFTTSDRVLLTWNDFNTDEVAQLRCGSRDWLDPYDWSDYGGFRIVWSLRAH